MILDAYVLDVTYFMDEHPGGRFSLEHNIGRDISKFFHGGYSLENTNFVANHTHSSDARKIVESLVYAKLKNNASRGLMKVAKSQADANQAGTAKTI